MAFEMLGLWVRFALSWTLEALRFSMKSLGTPYPEGVTKRISIIWEVFPNSRPTTPFWEGEQESQ